MKLTRINLERAAKTPLEKDDERLLATIFQSRMRTFLLVFGSIAIWPGVTTCRDIPAHGIMKALGIIFAMCLFVVVPAILIFWNAVWAYRRDIKAGYKYMVYEQVIDKKYFPITGQYFLSLEDAQYMHHEVEEHTWSAVNIGDRYPVYFAAHSRYAFNLRGRVTMM